MMTVGAQLRMYVSVAMAQTQTTLQLQYHTFLCIQAQHTAVLSPWSTTAPGHEHQLHTCCSKSSQTALATPLAGSDRRNTYVCT